MSFIFILAYFREFGEFDVCIGIVVVFRIINVDDRALLIRIVWFKVCVLFWEVLMFFKGIWLLFF